MAEVVWRESAFDDIERIRLNIAQDSPARAADFVNRIFQAVESLARFLAAVESFPISNGPTFVRSSFDRIG